VPPEKSTPAHFTSVDDYIDSHPLPVRPILERVRAIIRKALPKAEESISYHMPTYKMDGEPVLYFAGWKKHYSLYPINKQVAAAFAAELSKYELNKSTVRFPLTAPIPTKLISNIAKFRASIVTKNPAATMSRANGAPIKSKNDPDRRSLPIRHQRRS
jgi:uncharacterized protein YdhG (YjbR/CyaY superfamily)